MTPATIGKYNIQRELGRGGMATVYLALDPRFEREVAIKVLPRQFLHDSDFRVRFEREAQMIARLEHPAIVPVYDFGEEGDQPYLVMRYMPGGSLADRLTDRPMSLKQALPVVERIAAALQVAHDSGIVHRDLKPGNILFDQFDNPYLSDFGIAKLAAQTQTFTQGIIGTPAFMSPEQWKAKEELDGRTDQYALAIILFKMLSGDLPYKANETSGYMVAHISEPVPDILTRLPQLPRNVSNLLQKGLAKDRDERFESVERFATAYKAIAEGQRIPATFFQTKAMPPAPETEVVPEEPLIRQATKRPSSRPRSKPEQPVRTQQRPPVQPQVVRPRPTPNNRSLTKWLIPALIGLVIVALLGVGQATGMLSGILGGARDGDGNNQAELTDINGQDGSDENPVVPVAGETSTPTATPSPPVSPTAAAEAEVEPTVFATDTPLPTFTPQPTATATNVPTATPTATIIPSITPTTGPIVTIPGVIIPVPSLIAVTLIPLPTRTPTPFPIITLQPPLIVTINPIVIPNP